MCLLPRFSRAMIQRTKPRTYLDVPNLPLHLGQLFQRHLVPVQPHAPKATLDIVHVAAQLRAHEKIATDRRCSIIFQFSLRGERKENSLLTATTEVWSPGLFQIALVGVAVSGFTRARSCCHATQERSKNDLSFPSFHFLRPLVFLFHHDGFLRRVKSRRSVRVGISKMKVNINSRSHQ